MQLCVKERLFVSTDTTCPKCTSQNVYSDGNLWICPECFHEWSLYASEVRQEVEEADATIRDAHGNVLQDGDSVTVIKELKIKGSSSVVKVGTKVRNIRLADSDDGHNIACKIDGLGSINLKSEFVKKA
jgi:protein PhnA